jgi:uncharacterized protein YjdB
MIKIHQFIPLIFMIFQLVQSEAQIVESTIANWEDKVPVTSPGPDVWQYFTSSGTSEIIPNPVPDEINSTQNVLAYYRPDGEWLLTGFYYMDGIPITRNITGIEFKIYGDSLYKCYVKLIGIIDGLAEQTIIENSWPWTVPDGPKKWNTISLPINGDAYLNDTLTTILIFPNPQEPEASQDTFYFDEVRFLMTIPVDSIVLNSDTAIIEVNQNIYLEATVFPVNATNQNFTWKSSNSDIATVSSIGKVHAISSGTTDIIVISEDGDITDTCHIIVYTASGINNYQQEILHIYPNPYHGGELSINLPQYVNNGINLTIIDLQGKILIDYDIDQPGNPIIITPDLLDGVYIIKVKSGINTWYSRIIQY